MAPTPGLRDPARLAGKVVLTCQTDGRLVDLVRAGDDRAFEVIVKRHRGALLAHCRSLLPEARAEDAVQQAFVKAFAAIRANDDDLRLRAWLVRIAHNASLDALRQSGWDHEPLEDDADGEEHLDDALERRERLRDLLAAVETLPERQRSALLLRELAGRSYDEIAAELGVSRGAARQLLSRARGTLRAGASALTPVGLILRLPGPAPGGLTADQITALCASPAGTEGIVRTAAAIAATAAAVTGGSQISSDEGGRDTISLAGTPQLVRLTALGPATARAESRGSRDSSGVRPSGDVADGAADDIRRAGGADVRAGAERRVDRSPPPVARPERRGRPHAHAEAPPASPSPGRKSLPAGATSPTQGGVAKPEQAEEEAEDEEQDDDDDDDDDGGSDDD